MREAADSFSSLWADSACAVCNLCLFPMNPSLQASQTDRGLLLSSSSSLLGSRNCYLFHRRRQMTSLFKQLRKICLLVLCDALFCVLSYSVNGLRQAAVSGVGSSWSYYMLPSLNNHIFLRRGGVEVSFSTNCYSFSFCADHTGHLLCLPGDRFCHLQEENVTPFPRFVCLL